jgi:hypothetical protein
LELGGSEDRVKKEVKKNFFSIKRTEYVEFTTDKKID